VHRARIFGILISRFSTRDDAHARRRARVCTHIEGGNAVVLLSDDSKVNIVISIFYAYCAAAANISVMLQRYGAAPRRDTSRKSRNKIFNGAKFIRFISKSISYELLQGSFSISCIHHYKHHEGSYYSTGITWSARAKLEERENHLRSSSRQWIFTQGYSRQPPTLFRVVPSNIWPKIFALWWSCQDYPQRSRIKRAYGNRDRAIDPRRTLLRTLPRTLSESFSSFPGFVCAGSGSNRGVHTVCVVRYRVTIASGNSAARLQTHKTCRTIHRRAANRHANRRKNNLPTLVVWYLQSRNTYVKLPTIHTGDTI